MMTTRYESEARSRLRRCGFVVLCVGTRGRQVRADVDLDGPTRHWAWTVVVAPSKRWVRTSDVRLHPRDSRHAGTSESRSDAVDAAMVTLIGVVGRAPARVLDPMDA